MRGDVRETSFDYIVGDEKAVAWSSEPKVMRLLHSLHQRFPNDVEIVKVQDEKDGSEWSVSALVPVSWIKLSPPRKRNMTDEEKQRAAERLKEARAKRARQK